MQCHRSPRRNSQKVSKSRTSWMSPWLVRLEFVRLGGLSTRGCLALQGPASLCRRCIIERGKMNTRNGLIFMRMGFSVILGFESGGECFIGSHWQSVLFYVSIFHGEPDWSRQIEPFFYWESVEDKDGLKAFFLS